MATCPYCNTELFEDFNFCVQCSQQTKCLHCGTYLLKDKTICLRCGTPIKTIGTGATNLNTYTFEEDITETTSHKRVHLTATNEAVAAFLPRLPLGQESQSNTPSRATIVSPQSKALEESPPQIENDPTQQDSVIESKTDAMSVEALFVEDNEHEIIPNRRLRAYLQALPSKAAKQKTFSIFFVSAYSTKFANGVNSERLVKAVKNEGFYDTNYLRNLRSFAKDFLINKPDGYELQPYEGDQFVQEAINNIENPDYSPKLDQKHAVKRNRGKGRPKAAEINEVEVWLQKSVEGLDKFDSRDLQTPLEWGLFGLYVLTRHLAIVETVTPGSLYLYLSKKYATMSHSRKNFVDAITRSKKLGRNAQGAVFLDTKNEEYITQMIHNSTNR